ncbi:hypothetical protein ACFLVJ_00730 [Chloroflexota bacterium]
MAKVIALVVAIFILSLPVPVLAAEPNVGAIEGQIVNGTADGSSVADQDITLKIYLNGDETEPASSVTDAEGQFTFNSLSIESEYSYEVSLFYQEAEYLTSTFSFSENQTTRAVNITVYDSTADNSDITVAMAHTIINATEDGIDVTEYYSFVNNSDLTYIGSEVINDDGAKKTLSFSLPVGITSFQPTMGLMDCCIFSIENGFTDTMAVMPGMKDISFSYTIDTGSAEYTLPLKLNYPVFSYDLVVQGAEAVNASQLTAEEPFLIENVQYSHYSGDNLPANKILTIGLGGLPVGTNQGNVIWIVAAVTLLGGGFSLVYLMKKRNIQMVSIEDSPEQVRQRLLFQLAQLDDDFESGKIGEEDYKRARAEGKIQLVELMQKVRDEKVGR